MQDLDNFYLIAPLIGWSYTWLIWPGSSLPITPLQISTMPILAVCCSCLGWGNAFVSMLVVCSVVRQDSGYKRPSSIFSHTQWNLESMCLVLLWNIRFFAIATAESLSQAIDVVFFCEWPSSSCKFLNHEASFPASHIVIYLALVLDCAVILCLFDFQVIVPPAPRKTYPVVNFWSLQSAYAVSENLLRVIVVPGSCLYTIL